MLSHWKTAGADRVGIPGGHARWMGTMDFSTFFDICITAARVGLPSLSLPLCFARSQGHGKEKGSQQQLHGTRKQVYVQHHYTACYHYTAALILRDDTRAFKDSPIPQKALPALSLAM